LLNFSPPLAPWSYNGLAGSPFDFTMWYFAFQTWFSV
jgi:hypothetical protein